MESPQIENGYARIANKILEALARFRIPGEQMQCVMAILRNTYGWRRKEAQISLNDFFEITEMKKSNISRALKQLILKKIIIKSDNFNPPKYSFNKKFWEWGPVIKNDNALSKVIKHDTQPPQNKEKTHDLPPIIKSDKALSKVIKNVIKSDNPEGTPPIIVKDNKDIFLSDSVEIQLSKLLFNRMLQNNPNAKKPNFQKWAKNIDLAIRIDKRTPEQLEMVIRWCQQDDFWCANILSTQKLREKFDQLFLKMNKSQDRGLGAYEEFIFGDDGDE